MRSAYCTLRFTRQPGFGEPPFEQPDAVMAPERLALENEDRHAENLVRRRLLVRPLVLGHALAREVVAIRRLRQAEAGDNAGDGVRLVHLQLATEELVKYQAAVLQEAPLPLGEQPANERRRAVVDLERPLDDKSAGPQVGPAPRVEVGVPDLVLGIDAALALALEPQL